MSDFSEYADLPVEAPAPTLLLSLRMGSERLRLVAHYTNPSEFKTGAKYLWSAQVARPEGKTLAECTEAGLWRIGQASAGGLLLPDSWRGR